MRNPGNVLLLLLVFVSLSPAQFKPAAGTGQTVNTRAVLETNDPTGGFIFSADSATLWLSAGRKAMQYDVATGKLLKSLDFHSSDNPDWHMVPITAMIGS